MYRPTTGDASGRNEEAVAGRRAMGHVACWHSQFWRQRAAKSGGSAARTDRTKHEGFCMRFGDRACGRPWHAHCVAMLRLSSTGGFKNMLRQVAFGSFAFLV